MMKPQINFDDFSKIDLRVGEVVEATDVEGSGKLLKLRVSFGEEIGEKTIFAGVRKWYESNKLTGKKLIFIVNLAPKIFKIGDQEYQSQGMLLAADAGGRCLLNFLDDDLPAGTIIR